MSKDDARPKLNSVRPSPPADDGIRKTAILIESLDQPTAEVLFGQLSLELAAHVRAALLELGEVDPREREQVLAEFLDAGFGSAPELEKAEIGEAGNVPAEKFAANSDPVVVSTVDDVSRQAPGTHVDASLRDTEGPRRGVMGVLSPASRHRAEPESPPADASTADLARGLAHEHCADHLPGHGALAAPASGRPAAASAAGATSGSPETPGTTGDGSAGSAS